MAKLVDALVSGTSGGNSVEVQVLFAAPANMLLSGYGYTNYNPRIIVPGNSNFNAWLR